MGIHLPANPIQGPALRLAERPYRIVYRDFCLLDQRNGFYAVSEEGNTSSRVNVCTPLPGDRATSSIRAATCSPRIGR